MRLARIGAAAGVLVLACLLGWRLTHQHNATAAAIVRGKVVPAPAFRLPRLVGHGTLSLAALRGHAVVLNFWASDCIPCKKEMPRLQQAYERWSGKGVSVVGIDVIDSRGAASAFVRAHGVTYPIGFDQPGDTTGPYGVLYTPTTFFIDRRGRIVKRVLGPVPAAQIEAQITRARAS
jgi:peroxiredoxin